MRGRTVLFVGAGRDQRPAILRAKQLGLRVVAVDHRAEAPGLADADVAAVVAAGDVAGVVAVARANDVEGVLTVATDEAVPVVAAAAESLGLPGIGRRPAHVLTNKIAMRRVLAEAGVPQPRFAAARGLHEARAAAGTVGFPAVLKPADAGDQRGVFRLESIDDLDAHLHAALAESAEGEVIVERFHDGLELNGIVIVRGGEGFVLTLSDRLRPDGPGFGVGWIHVYPARIFGATLEETERVAVHAVRALGLRDGIAFAQLLVDDGDVLVVEIAARIPGGQMADLVRHAVGVDLVEIALRQALGEDVPDEACRPVHQQPLAVRFLTAAPGPLPTGVVRRVGPIDRALSAPGVVQAELFLRPGDEIGPVRTGSDRHGYVIAVADTNLEALERAETAAALVEVAVESSGRRHSSRSATSQTRHSG